MEEPGYWLARNVFTGAGCRLVPVPVDGEGVDVRAGIERCRNPKAAYVTPSHQYPLGVTMSASRRLQLLDWASSGAWIIEDDYDSEYRYDRSPIASLQGLDSGSRVIYVGTFSKVLFPSLRLGYMVVPPDLVDHFVAVRSSMDIAPPYPYQAVLRDFMRDGHFARHVRRMRSLYSERRHVLVETLRKEFQPPPEVVGAEAGMHLTIVTSKQINDREISTKAAQEKLWLWPLSPCYITRPARQGFILGFGNTPIEAIPSAVGRLRALMTVKGQRFEPQPGPAGKEAASPGRSR